MKTSPKSFIMIIVLCFFISIFAKSQSCLFFIISRYRSTSAYLKLDWQERERKCQN